MKVLIEGLQAGNRSGTGVYTERLVRELPRVADDLELVVLWPAGLPSPTPSDGRTTFVPCRTGHGFRFLASPWTLRREAGRRRVDVVHYPASVGNLLPLRHTVLTVHDLSFLHHPEWFRRDRALYLRQTVARSVRRAARIVADSRATARDLEERLGVASERVDVIPLGVDEALAPAPDAAQEEARRKYGLPDRFLLYMGTLEPRKNLVRVVEAFGRIADEYPGDLVLAGRYGWKTGALMKAVLASPHTARIHLPGFIAEEDKAAVLSAADVFVWPSLYEGFGLPPLEAMACGVPVVTSDRSSLPEAVGDAAVTVPPEDVEALTEGLRRLIADPARAEALRAAGRERAAAFTWRRTAERTLETYRKVAAA